MEHGCQVATVLTLLQCCYHFMPSTVPREELLGSDEQQGVARGFLSECPFKCILWIMAHSPKRVGKFRCVCSDSLTSSGNNYNFDKVFDLFPHNMFRRLAPCSIIEYIPPPGTTGPTDISKIAFIHNCLALSQFLGHMLGTQRPQ